MTQEARSPRTSERSAAFAPDGTGPVIHESLRYIPVSQIELAPQVRDGVGDEESMLGLMASMEAIGLQQPIRVKGNLVIDGHRRLEAARRLGWTDIATIEETRPLDASGTLVRQLVANVQRLDLSDAERGRAFMRLMQESGWTAAETSRHTGVSQAMISRLTAVLTDPEIATLVSDGRLPASTGYALVRVRDSKERAELIKQAVDGGMTRDDITARAKTLARTTKVRKRPPMRCPRVVLRLAGNRSVAVSGPDLSVGNLVTWIGELFSQLNGLKAGGLTLAQVVSSLSGKQR